MWSLASEFLGGLGLLLIGMSLMTDGLKLAAGSALRDLLASWTNTRLRGLLAGFLITGIVQSSSAVTVATIGFANAGMLSLERAIWVIFGSNVGTTTTAWVVALVGFKLDIQALALPLLGVGALLKLSGAQSRRASYGLALVGFGMLFLGIGVLKGAFEGLGSDLSLPSFERMTLFSLLVYVAIGFVLTSLMQSSSAALVVALSAAQSGLVELNAAAAVVIGANLGTTSTALLTIFGATANAKRVAVAHLGFNLVTAMVAMLLLAPMLWVVNWIQASLGLGAEPAMTLALFHTVFNVLGVFLMWPLSPWLVRALATRFRAPERHRARPHHLDRATLSVPFTAVSSMALETQRVALISLQALEVSVRPGTQHHWKEARDDIRELASAVADFATALNRTPLTQFLSQSVTGLLESVQQYLLVVNLNQEIEDLETEAGLWQQPVPELEGYIASVGAFIAGWQARFGSGRGPGPDFALVEASYRAVKLELLQRAGTGRLSMSTLDIYLQYMNEVKRACRQLGKANVRLMAIRESLEIGSGDGAPRGENESAGDVESDPDSPPVRPPG